MRTMGYFLALFFAFCAEGNAKYNPPSGFVPDKLTALAVAEAIALPIYGKDILALQRPLQARLVGDRWIVTGTLPNGWNGGVVKVTILRRTGEIVSIEHGR